MQRLQTIVSRFQPATLLEPTVDEDRRRRFMALSLLVSIPAVLSVGIVDLWYGRWLEGWLVCVAAVLLLVALISLRYVQNLSRVFRFCIILMLLVITTELLFGIDDLVFLWMYVFPLILFYIFGRQEGLVWVIISMLLMSYVFSGVSPANYELAISVRFLSTYAIVAILSFGLEAARERYYDALLAEKEALESALTQVKTLSGLLPICASCKKIRDDEGYWNDLEAYFAEHSDLEFTHGLCPNCAEDLYPEFMGKS